jgi:hypothetical protein
MLGMLPTVRGWLAEKREAAARGRVFAYRRFLTPKELGITYLTPVDEK